MRATREIQILCAVFVGLMGWALWEALPPAVQRGPITEATLTAEKLAHEAAFSRESTVVVAVVPPLKPVAHNPSTRQRSWISKEGVRMGQAIITSGSGNWTVPDGVTSIDLLLVGGGGGGISAGMAAGGGGGGSISRTGIGVAPGEMFAYAVGAGGFADANGGDTTFDSLTAGGGQAGGFGGGGAGGTGDYTGGNGSNGSVGSTGGGGGSSGGRSANGNNGGTPAGGTAVSEGGAGGAGGVNGSNGSSPGGGGGGASGEFGAGGEGGAGYIQIDWEDLVEAPTNSGYQSNTDAASWGHTVSGDDPFLIVAVCIIDAAASVACVPAPNFNGDAMFLIRDFQLNQSAPFQRIMVWGLKNPDAGIYSVNVELTSSCDWVGMSWLYNDVNLDFPIEGKTIAYYPGSDVDAEVDVVTVTADCIIHAVAVTDDGSVTAGQTERNLVTGADGTAVQEDSNSPVAAGTTTMSIAGVGAGKQWIMIAFAIRPAGSAGFGAGTMLNPAAGFLLLLD